MTIVATSQASLLEQLAAHGIKIGRTTLWKWMKQYAPERFKRIGRTIILEL